MTEILPRKKAIQLGLTRYFTGKSCKHGHVSERQVSNRECYECVMTSCKRKARQLEYQSRSEVKARRKEYMQEWHKSNRPTEIRIEKQRAASRKWRQNNLDHARKLNREYAERRKEKRHAYSKDYAKKHPEKMAAKVRNRRARLRNNGGTHTVDDVTSIKKLQKNKCAYCRASVKNKYHVDHIIPITLDGRNDRTNLQILCPTCNHQKHSKHPLDFTRSLGMLL